MNEKLISNQQISECLLNVSLLLELKSDSPYRINSYRKASIEINRLDFQLSKYFNYFHRLPYIPGVGKGLTEAVIEIIGTGTLDLFIKLKKEIPLSLIELFSVRGLGKKRILKLWRDFGIKNIKELKMFAIDGKLADIPGFGIKSQGQIIRSISFFEENVGFLLRSEVKIISDSIIEYLSSRFPGLSIEIVGDYRRGKAYLSELSLLATFDDQKRLIDFFLKYPNSKKKLHLKNHGVIFFKSNFQIELFVTSKNNFACNFLYLTGSSSHIKLLEQRANQLGMLLSDDGLFKNNKIIDLSDELKIYNHLKMDWIPPELREGLGEIELSTRGKLPQLANFSDIRGDFHIHSDRSDGSDTIFAIAKKAIELRYDYIAISDHSKHLSFAHGLNEFSYLRQFEQIDLLNDKLFPFRIFKCAEIDILEDGEIDINSSLFGQMDFMILSIHDHFGLSRSLQTKRILKALTHKGRIIFGHPTTRVFKHRPPLDVDWDKVIDFSIQRKIIFEINCFSTRMDPDDHFLRSWSEAGLDFCIGTDAHCIKDLSQMKDGVSLARRGWIKREKLLNTFSLNEVLSLPML